MRLSPKILSKLDFDRKKKNFWTLEKEHRLRNLVKTNIQKMALCDADNILLMDKFA